ncbi:vWA domain-containing protein [Chryseosolibacter indicus]|uniref:VWA domain-containing protein n=1 Tax=Chryseosolibacter indicus TaxID=2782351 RepID=A0ABS5VTV6_9BACT|nr:VWA domain-containing protein [Chryseosolibacter indicus]MBT1704859.1 VWA domain-containing protein [Chryseosolibacter indicus]
MLNWYRDLGVTEFIFIGAFLVLYALYVARIIYIAKQLNTPFTTIFIKLTLRTIYFSLFIIALLGPSFGGGKKEVKSVGKDIMICVDLSKSMDAFDIQPTRLEKIKFEMKRLIASFNSDRIGVIIFGSESFMQCPLTFDQNALNLFIETMNTGLVPASGTDFAPPLRMALQKLTDEEGKTGQTKSKVIILISDGEDFGEETSDIVKDIEEKDIKLFTLGVGTQQGGNIYASNGLKKDREGNVVVTKLNSTELKELARKTDGQYFEINESRNDVSKLINTISKIEGELRDARYIDVTANKYYYFLAVAALLLLADILFNVKTVRI